ncbi:cytochrome P450 [Rhodocollybia butyracea]|uniref:Cytochrome P450 n=1 Tax=Rhodocollybia butyracea TaxID=206335 RepID=A0A9P5PYV7_9AGAR|nr:cytochrome P450 [Rhodocollybia butyracea]
MASNVLPGFLGSTTNIAFVLIGVFVVYLYMQRQRSHTSQLPTPPGPKPAPVIGNLFDIPREKESAGYNVMAKKYGDLTYLSILGKSILVVNNYATAQELFEKRSANYSDRNELPMINDLMGWDWSFGHMPYGGTYFNIFLGPRWKMHRSMFHRQFQSSVVSSFWPIQLKEAHKLVRRMLHHPEDLINHLRFNSASIIMNVTYGIEIEDEEDHYITVAETALDGMAKAANPGAFFVDIFPVLKYVPSWMPFAGFKRKAAFWRKSVLQMRNAPFQTVTNAVKLGTASPSFVSNLLSDLELRKDLSESSITTETETIRNCAGLAYAAGAESIVSSLSSFMLAMVLYPEVQIKARRELDSVIGSCRLPDFSDRGSLPYIDAIVKEVLRWNPVAPLGLPHMATKEDEFGGYRIPAGTLVLGNSWTILHDPTTYPDPMAFNPDRFLSNDPAIVDPVYVAFGYGRRICPGRFMAEGQLWISIACILSVFEIKPGNDEKGRPIKTEAAFTSGMIWYVHPLPFMTTINPRDDSARQLIEQTTDLVA